MTDNNRNGRIITFYSYKGGTGRSMALANVAWILASNRMRVLTIDWDLEAPGLHRYFSPFLVDKNLEDTEGLIDFVTDFALDAMSLPKDETEVPEDWYLNHANIIDYAVSIEWQFPTGGAIDFVPAGRQGPSYARRFGSFDWQNFYEQMGGGVFLEAAKRQMRAEYDYVLIDSRTGVSDTAGICTVQMPDALVVCFTLNNQSSHGAANIARSVFNQRRAVDDGFRIYPVPMRVDLFEKEKLDRRRRYAQRMFRPFLLESMGFEVDSYWPLVEIPYIPHLAYEEVLTPFVENPNDPKSALSALGRLTEFITDGKVTQFHFPIPPVEQQRVLLAFSESPSDFGDAQVDDGGLTLNVEDLIKTAEAEYGWLSLADQARAREVWSRLVRVGHLNSELVYEATRTVQKDFDGLEATFIGRFIDAGLLKRSKDELTGEISFEPVEASFLKQWHRLQQWIKEDSEFLLWRQDTHKLAAVWEQSGRNNDYLLRGAPLKKALAWSRRFDARLDRSETSFVQRSYSVDKSEESRWWWISWGTVSAFVIILILSVILLLTQKSNYDTKIAAARQAFEDNYRGLEQLKAGDVQGAIASFQSSIKHKEDYYDALYNLGTAYMRAGNYIAAQASFSTLKDRDANRADAYIGIADSLKAQGRALDEQGDLEGAQKKYDEALKSLAQLKGPNLAVPSESVRQLVAYKQGLIYYDKKDYTSAVSEFTQAIGINPNYAEAFLGRGKAYAQIGAFDRAVADLEAVKAKSQDSTLVNDATRQIQEIKARQRPTYSSSS